MDTRHEHDSTGHGQHHGSHAMAFDSDAGVTFLEVEGETFAGFTREAATALAPFLEASNPEVRQVVDLGCGPGVATCDLAEIFESAVIVAADVSAAMLERAAARAAQLGWAARVEPRRIDLDGDLRPLGNCDVVYASMSLHHVRDEIATLAQLRSMLEPRGVLCVLERADPPVIRLADERGRPAIWTRLDDAWQRWFEEARGHLPGATRAEMYPSMLVKAGFDVEVDQTLSLSVDMSSSDAARQFAARHLQRARIDLARYADAADLDVLSGLVHALSAATEDGVDGEISATRKLFIATPAS